tara:strand:- start:1489 stop:1929 length:441 start_codon:yes stop_codon:yes gene_type:complete
MGNWYLFAILTVAFLFPIEISTELVPVAHAQTAITVPESTPCFMNYTAGANMWDQCNFEEDFLNSALLPFEWITGGNFSLVLVSIFILFTYIKYHNVLYPILIGILFIPVSFFVFPDEFITFGVLMVAMSFGLLIYYIITKQTKEY